MGYYTLYKAYMTDKFWPWWWDCPCKTCKCDLNSFFSACPNYQAWLSKKPEEPKREGYVYDQKLLPNP